MVWSKCLSPHNYSLGTRAYTYFILRNQLRIPSIILLGPPKKEVLSLEFRKLSIPDVILVESPVFKDQRGFFQETYHRAKFALGGIEADFVQDNRSFSVQGVLRGLHYQIKKPQGKLVRAMRGRIFDVAVDLRKGSSTFGEWVGEFLSEENGRQLWVPAGFAHGFLVLSEIADVVYKCTDFYAPNFERIILWNDPKIGIRWPVQENVELLIADRDLAAHPLEGAEVFT